MGTPQLNLDRPPALPTGAYDYGERTSGETHGVVLTKAHVVSLILDLAGYVPDRDLSRIAFLEPSCGHGAFVVRAVERLMASAKDFRRSPKDLGGAIRAYDIEASHVALTRQVVVEALQRHGVKKARAEELAETWILCGDFLLASRERRFDVVVGNPPYIRIEQLSRALQEEYRRRYPSLYDRADLYVAFIERGLNLLSQDGVLAFICADRWILNKYGAPLRRLLSERFGVRSYIDMHRASPFDSEVIAYPSIFAVSPGTSGRVHVGVVETASPEECSAVLSFIE
ncbi:MAG: Eco57I restriction-modification methylase domain-containing protein, partial [Polyangiaceae bacterium]